MKNVIFNPSLFAANATQWLKNYAESNGQTGFVIGVSGGIDSAVASTLCAETGLPLLVIEMPIHQGEEQVTRAQNHIAWLKSKYDNVQSTTVNLTSVFDNMLKAFEDGEGQLEGLDGDSVLMGRTNTRSRLRMVTLYQFAASTKRLVCGTGNKVEDFGIGFYTKYGDGGVDVSPIGDITKTEVYAVASSLGINQEIIDAKPTDGLWGDSRSDEDQIGASYPELEWAMDFYENNIVPRGEGVANSSISTIVSFVAKQETENVGRKQDVMRIFLTRNRANKHKMNAIPVFDSASCRENAYSTERA